MAARTSADNVKKIMPDCSLDNIIIDAYIIGANLIVTNVFSGDTDISADLLAEIERWLTAHMVASTVWRMAKREKLGEAEIEYTGKFGEDLASTPYGQAVKTLDTTGKMSKLGKKAATIYAIESFE